MKNICASVGAIPMQEKKQIKKTEEKEEEECIHMKNEMIFFLKEYPECQITGVAEWGENSQGDTVKELDTYFRHILTGQRCETPWACLLGVSEFNECHEEIWETLCMRIENHENVEEDMCYEKRVEV